jgi:hypothetical protein
MFKHVTLLHTEFLKLARKWEDLSIEEQRKYVFKHPKSKKQYIIPHRLSDEGKLIARKLHLTYNGFWPDAGQHTFTDSKTHTTILGKDLEDTKSRLEQSRENFRKMNEKYKYLSQAAKIHREFAKLAFTY